MALNHGLYCADVLLSNYSLTVLFVSTEHCGPAGWHSNPEQSLYLLSLRTTPLLLSAYGVTDHTVLTIRMLTLSQVNCYEHSRNGQNAR